MAGTAIAALPLASPAYASGGWTAPAATGVGSVTSVSCVQGPAVPVVLCVAVDGSGNAVTYNGTSWSSPVATGGGALTSVSCASATFCVAVAASGDAVTYNGTSWTAPVAIDSGALASVSCAPSSLCMAVDGGGNSVGSWSGPIPTGAGALTSVSCVPSGFCVAVDRGGDAVTYNGQTWSSPAPTGAGTLSSVSCASADFCVAVDSGGNAVTDNGTGWATPVAIDTAALSSVSCAPSDYCVAVDRSGNEVTFAGSTWSAPANVDPSPLTSVSCASAAFCLAVDSNGDAAFAAATPSITALGPSSGPLAVGTHVNIWGTALEGASSVSFGSTPESATANPAGTMLTTEAPVSTAPGPVTVTVTTPGGTSNELTFTYLAPSITSLDPASGPLVAGTKVTIFGAGLNAATSVSFGSTEVGATPNCVGSSVTVEAPAALNPGGVAVTVNTPGGTSNGLTFTYGAPTVTRLSVAAGPLVGATKVTIAGTGLNGATSVTFGPTEVGATVNSIGTVVTATSPANGTPGPVKVTVSTPSGNSNGLPFTYLAPTITKLSPTSVIVGTDPTVTLSGSGLEGAESVWFGSTPVSCTVNSAGTLVTATAPISATPGPVSVSVQTPEATSNALSAHYVAPTIATLSPSSGPLVGGIRVVVNGSNLGGSTSVLFGNTAVPATANGAGTAVVALAPANATPGPVAVTVVTPDGNSNGATFTYTAPTITRISPATGRLMTDSLVTITGTDLQGATSVVFGSTSVPCKVNASGTSVATYTPATESRGAVSVTVETPKAGSNPLTFSFA